MLFLEGVGGVVDSEGIEGVGGHGIVSPEMSTTSTLLQEALDLPSRDRAELALKLMESLDDGESCDVEAAWAVEVKDRVEALRRGEVKTRPAADVFRDARARLSARR